MEKFLKQIIREAGYLAKGFYEEGVDCEYKVSASDFVTKADREVEFFIRAKIKEKYPDHAIMGEEHDLEGDENAEYKWVIDPIDGTRNFVKHIAIWCTLIGITKNSKPYMSAVYDAINDELFFAQKGKGAYLNDKKIRVSDVESIEHCYLIFSGGMRDYCKEEDYERYMHWQERSNEGNGLWIHNYGTMLPACHLAAGRIDAFVNNTGKYHDNLAPYIIATEAGAKWTNSYGEEWNGEDRDTVVGNPKLNPKLLLLFR